MKIIFAYGLTAVSLLAQGSLKYQSVSRPETNALTRSAETAINEISVSANSFISVQDAINAASGKALVFYPGTYTCSGLTWGTANNIQVILKNGANITGCTLPTADTTHWIIDQTAEKLNSLTINGQGCTLGSSCTVADATKVPTSTTVNNHPLSSNVTVTPTDVFGAAVNAPNGPVTQDANGNVILSATLPGAAIGGTVPHWEKFTISYTSLTANATTQTITLTTLPTLAKIQGITLKHSTAFTGTGLTAMTVSIGGAATVTDFTNPFDVFQAVAPTAFLDKGGSTSGSTMASQVLTATFTATGANLGDGTNTTLTAGSVNIWLLVSTLE